MISSRFWYFLYVPLFNICYLSLEQVGKFNCKITLDLFLKVKLKLTSDDPNANYVTKYDISFGRCYSVQLKPQVTALGVTKVEFRANLNIYIYLHHPGQYMDVDSKTKVMFFPLLYLDVQD